MKNTSIQTRNLYVCACELLLSTADIINHRSQHTHMYTLPHVCVGTEEVLLLILDALAAHHIICVFLHASVYSICMIWS